MYIYIYTIHTYMQSRPWRPASRSRPIVAACRAGSQSRLRSAAYRSSSRATANLRTKVLDFRGFDSSIILMLRGGILVYIGNSPDVLSHGILVGIILVGRLGVRNWIEPPKPRTRPPNLRNAKCGDDHTLPLGRGSRLLRAREKYS